MGDKRNIYLGLMDNFERKRPPERPEASWKDRLSTYVKYISRIRGCGLDSSGSG
jgi:hypothetical protein